MRTNFAESCQFCDNRLACDVAVAKGRRLERRAGRIGLGYIEGAVVCSGREYVGSADVMLCHALVTPPSFEAGMGTTDPVEFADLQTRASSLLQETKQLVEDIR